MPWLSQILTLVLALNATCALATTHRFAIVLGNDTGLEHDETLLYASSDAERMAEVLSDLGGVQPENLMLLQNGSTQAIRDALAEMNQRIAAWPRAEGDEVLVLFYYSGHADAVSLNIAGEQLSYRELKDGVEALEVDVSILVIDACHSGEMTRLKGAEPAAPFRIELDSQLEGRGTAIITSSSANEGAQESDHLQGSFFTHHFVVGLRGAADVTGDRKVTLDEAYQYAYDETLRSSSRARFVQHPEYAFELQGRRQVVLTHLSLSSNDHGRVRFEEAGSYLLFRGDPHGPLVAETRIEEDGEIVLEPGNYTVRYLLGGQVWEGELDLQGGQTVSMGLEQMQPLTTSEVLRKGSYGEQSSWAAWMSGGVAGAVIPRSSMLAAGSVGFEVEASNVLGSTRFRYATGAGQEGTSRYHHFGLDVGALYLYRPGDFSLGVGGRAGADVVWQRFTTSRLESRQQLVPRIGVEARAGWSILPELELVLEGGANLVLFELQDEDGAEVWEAAVSPFASLGLSVLLP